MLAAGIPVGAGTDATRVASYNPWVALHWLVSGRTVGGTALYPEANRLDRMEALRLYTRRQQLVLRRGGARRARSCPGRLADFAVLSADYFSVPEAEIPRIESVLTLVGGQVVYGTRRVRGAGTAAAAGLRPSWSPVVRYGGYGAPGFAAKRVAAQQRRPGDGSAAPLRRGAAGASAAVGWSRL